MDLISRLRRWAVVRPRVLVIDAPGTTLLRWSIEEGIDRRGWSLASSPAETDLLLVLGTPRGELAEAIEVVWSQVPEPRHRLDVAAAGDVEDTLDAALAGLLDGAARPRSDDGGRPGPSTLLERAGKLDEGAGAMDNRAMDHSGHDGMDQSEHGVMDHDAMGHDAMGHDAMGRDAMGRDAMDHDAMHHGEMDHGDMEHSGHGDMEHPDPGSIDHSQHGGMDHSGMDHSQHGGMDHSQQGGMDHSQQGGMDHSEMDHSQQGGMDHGGHGGMDDGGMDHGAMGHGGHGGMDHGSMAVAGLPMADTAPDRDGLQLDSLQISLGPVLGGWPTGLLLTGRLQGDLLTDVSLRWMDAEHGMNEPLHDGGATSVAALDQLVRLLEVAGWPTAARDARRARNRLLSDDPAQVEAGRRLAGQVAHRVSRSGTLAWSLRGLGAADGAEPGGIHGDVLDRVRRWCAIAAAEEQVETPREPQLARVAELLEGAELAAARLVVASLPLRHPVTRRQAVVAGA